MDLNYRIKGEGKTIVLLHGLFGSHDNLAMIAKVLTPQYQVIMIDLRNHGRSPHAPRMSYAAMAEDVVAVLDKLNIDQTTIIGHSMGGKVAMKVAHDWPDRVNGLVVLDIAPIDYKVDRHQEVFAGLRAVAGTTPSSRSEADSLLALHIDEPGVRQFLLKSLVKKPGENHYQWRFNLSALIDNYRSVMGWVEANDYQGPTLFVKGQYSEYILPEHKEKIEQQFPQAKARIIANTTHWLHIEKPDSVNRTIIQFLAELDK
ncbi:alpha/beta fold hydrolase [Vibrio sp. SS-MA-C1-2]|uniref:alpha/beta fold hydrolase n=1 Tax=Vibrio sp. SS-MA-C1-2 TaxID=2908646 RepID=UPI001F46116B|nr:alpha/beta fold hydrolase [Vibrio sp. SS-MA-C1-2]UJF18662.1 alpha/beta fold hydrolase [Vibrio sp. SS-MA-C1-2]